MNKFIWVQDENRAEHYINVDHIIRVTKNKPSTFGADNSYITLRDGKIVSLTKDSKAFDTFENVIEKIQQS